MDALIRRRTLLGGMLALSQMPRLALAREASALQGFTRTCGGEGRKVLRVTSLASRGEGTLRAALEADGPRHIRFDVGGVIDLGRDSLSIRNTTYLVAKVNRVLRGWANYFSVGTTSKAYRAIDSYTEVRLRRWLRTKYKTRGRREGAYLTPELYERFGLVRLADLAAARRG